MRAGLSTIQQTLTPDAANILTLSIAEAARRNHVQTTPLHVAATLLSSPNGLLRQACIKSHPNSSHPLQCRALELCFSVALDRLPASNNSGSDNNLEEPPISNALMAALKRAQAHQRRGCPEQQQSPLLAVKVELEQLVVSILDDPSVSRVMKEASFSSPSVKSAIEQTITPTPSLASSLAPSLSITSSIGPVRNLYMNPRLAQPQNQFRKKEEVGGGDVKKVMEILMRSRKRNPILVGDSDLSCMLKEVIERIERRELGSCVRIISLEKEFGFFEKVQIQEKVKELKGIIGNCKNDGVVINLGNLKWLVDYNGGLSGKGASDIGKEVVAEMKGILGNGGKVWAIGTATCATYLRCQVYFANMEVDWDLQAVPIAPRAPTTSGLFTRLGSNDGVLSSSIGPSPINKGFPMIKPSLVPLKWPSEKKLSDNPQKQALCTQCTEKYEHELGNLVSREFEKPSPDTNLPQWLQMATTSSIKPSQNKEQDHNWKKNTDELLEKWRKNCSQLHSSNVSTINPLLLQQNSNAPRGFPQLRKSPPPSPVRTELALGIPKPSNISPFNNVHKERLPLRANIANFEDSDSLKRLYKGLIDKVSWQTEAASAVTAAVLKSKSVSTRKHGLLPKTDTWLLFIGSDKLGKRKMANALSDLVFGVESTFISSEKNYHGRTALNHVVDTVKTNPSSVILIEDIDQRDEVFRTTIKRAIETGRLPDSYGREVTLRSTIFVLTANWLPDNDKCSNDLFLAEERILNSVHSNWELEVSIVGEKKRLPEWLLRDENSTKRVKEKDKLGLGLSLNLNLAISSENSSELTSEYAQDHGRLAIKQQLVSSAKEFIECVDNAVVFKPVDFVPFRKRILEAVSEKFNGVSIKFDDDVLDKIVAGVWLSDVKVEEWAENVLAPSISRMRSKMNFDKGASVRLSAVEVSGQQLTGKWLPSEVRLAGTCLNI